MYNVHIVKRYTVARFRARLAQVLDEVEAGEVVTIERRGRRFRLVGDDHATKREAIPPPFFAVTDDTLLEHGWTWDWRGPGEPMRLVTRRKRKSRA
jgi:prevent-host-death family protein